MTGEPGVIVTLDGEVHPAGTPLLFADDLAAVRGDGVFETLLVRDGGACLVEAHLGRLSHSAKLLELPEPDLAAWRHAIELAAGRWTRDTNDEAAMRLVYSRGRESGSAPTAYVTVNPVADRIATVRRDGPGGGDAAPRAAVGRCRDHAVASGRRQDVVLCHQHGRATARRPPRRRRRRLRQLRRLHLGRSTFDGGDRRRREGRRSNVCLLTPPPWYPILRGTTQQALFAVARAKGYDCDYRALRVADLFAAQGIWLVSSMTLAARVHTLDGRELPERSAGGRVRRPRRRRDCERSLKSVVGVALNGYLRQYTRKEVVREIDSLLDM